MTTSSFGDPRGAAPPRRVIASFDDYRDAERVVDQLSDSGFPVDRVAIVGRGLEMVEQVTGRLTNFSAMGRGAASGAVAGLLIGWLFGAFNWVAPLISGLLLALYGVVVGAVIGAVVGLVGHVATGGRRDFRSLSGVQAASFDVLVDADVADRAVQALRVVPAGGQR